MLEIVEGESSHVGLVRELSREVFSRFGDYKSYLPKKMLEPHVRTLVARSAGEELGFAMLDLVTAAEGVIDLTAIAVTPAAQGRGIGRALLSAAEARARAAVELPGAAMTLTVALDNHAARSLFETAGYRPVPGRRGRYGGGQRSMDMRKELARL